jgi:hypothetical protein
VFEKIKWGDLVTQSGNNIYLANQYGIGMLDADSLCYGFINSPGVIAGTDCF